MDDNTIREGIRQSLGAWLAKLECGGDAERQLQYRLRFLEKLSRSPICLANEESKEQHYEVPTEFFRLVLGPRMKYSCNLHSLDCQPSPLELASAEERALELLCQRAQIRDGMTIMDMGCGWGAFTIYALQRYPNCRLVSVSNSATQRRYILSAAEKAACGDRLQVVTQNIAHFDTELRFDRVVSVEMLEHMKNVGALLARVSGWLKPDGKLLTQILCHRRFSYNFDARRNSDTEWMARNFFTGGSMFSADLFLHMQQRLLLENMWLVNGRHYSRTLETWLAILDSKRQAAKAVFAADLGDEEAERQVRNWRLFFIFCSEAFAYDSGNQWLVAQHLFCNRDRAAL